MITEANGDCPDQLCCPYADEWLPLLKGPTPHLDKQHNQENIFNKYPLINVLSKFKAERSCLRAGQCPCSAGPLTGLTLHCPRADGLRTATLA